MIATASAGQVCPYLGLADDPGSRFSFAEQAHRCWAMEKPELVDLGYQATTCLRSDFVACGRYRSATRPIPAWHHAAMVPVGSTAVAARWPPHQRRRPRSTILLAVLVVLLIVLVAAIYAWTGWATPQGAAVVPRPTSSLAALTPIQTVAATPSATPMQTAAETPSPTETVASTATAVPAATSGPASNPPSQAPSATPLPTPSPLIYVVRHGDTLIRIANEFGITVGEIARANDLIRLNMIHIGQELVIPLP